MEIKFTRIHVQKFHTNTSIKQFSGLLASNEILLVGIMLVNGFITTDTKYRSTF